MNIGIIIAILAAIGLGVGAYFVFVKKKVAGVVLPPTPLPAKWNLQYSPNMPTSMTDNGDGTFHFDFPAVDGAHYVVENAPGSGLAAGKTLTMTYSVTGTGTVLGVQGNTPAMVTPYVQHQGDDLSAIGIKQQYRYWSAGHTSPLANGDYTISVPFNPDQWSDVYGKPGTDFPAGFADCLANAIVLGFTMGEPSLGATGHGAYVKDGTSRFTLKSFTIA